MSQKEGRSSPARRQITARDVKWCWTPSRARGYTEPVGSASRTDVADAAAPLSDRVIGARLRLERERQGLSLRKLAKVIGISPSALSQIETERSKPSVGTLYAIVSELGLSLDELFTAEPGRRAGADRSPDGRGAGASPGVGVQRGTERKRLTLESGVVWERLTPTMEPDVDFLHVTYEVGGASSGGERLMRHSGREYGLILEGRLRVTVGFEAYELEPGDSIAFDSTIPHRLETVGDRPACAVWLALGRYASDPRRGGLADRRAWLDA
jgi:transcriptional regulator with XRE-family HTH domain